MTIALGILASDGLVLAADTLHTIDRVWKGDQGKIMGVERHGRTPPEGPLFSASCIVTGAGRSQLLQALSQKLLKSFSSEESDEPEIIQSRLEGALKKFFGDNVVPYANFPDNSDDLQVLVAYAKNHRFGFWVSNRASLTSKHVACVGVGSVRASSILSRLKAVHELTVQEAVTLAAYAIYDAKRHVDGCGFYTDVVYIKDCRIKVVPRPVIEALEDSFRVFVEECEPQILQHVFAGDGTELPVDRLRDAQKAIADLRSRI